MKNRRWIDITTYAFLVLAVVVSFALPRMLPSRIHANPDASGATPPDEIRIGGIVRDFRLEHEDFNIVPEGGYGHYAGNISMTLGSNQAPVFLGGSAGTSVTMFTIADGQVIPGDPFAAMVSVLGSAIVSGSNDVPVTAQIQIGDTTIDAFGSFNDADEANLNDDRNPRRYIHETTFDAGTAITVSGRSWSLDGNTPSMTFNTMDDSPQIRVLRNGDPVPETPGFEGQASIEDYVGDYIDTATDTMKLLDNQIIYLFELGTTNLDSSAADFQDLVVLITLGTSPEWLATLDVFGVETPTADWSGYKVTSQWQNPTQQAIPPHLAYDLEQPLCGIDTIDTTGSRGGPANGGISSVDSFAGWFKDLPGTNLSAPHVITLTRDADGVYEYTTDAFYPADDQLFGNEGRDHNYAFTFVMTVSFEYDACAGQFIQFEGSDDAWAFINNMLGLDIGGIKTDTDQMLELDRLSLTDGERYTLRLFVANRQTDESYFSLRTNIFLEPMGTGMTFTTGYD